MGFIYKLIDEKELQLANEGVISLSHPIFEFKGSEGAIINFAKRIYDKYNNQGLKIKPSSTDLEDIKDWFDAYKITYGTDFKDIDIHSESMIMFCGIMQGYCGYFTNENLDDESIRNKYLEKNKLKRKIAYIKINSDLLAHQWHSKNLDCSFSKIDSEDRMVQDFNGFLHIHDVIYDKNYNNYSYTLGKYNSDSFRDGKYWFTILPDTYSWQNEKRLIFLLNSLEKNSIRIGCDNVYKISNADSFEQHIFENIIDAIYYCSNKGPRFILLNIGKENIEIKKL